MARAVKRLTARGAEALRTPGMHADGEGLYLLVTASGAKRWSFVYRKGEKRTELGLGRFADVSLAEARAKAAEARKTIALGSDPLDVKRATDKRRMRSTFADVADALVTAMEAGWRNQKHVAQWKTTLGLAPYNSQKVRVPALLHAEHVSALNALRAKAIEEVGTEDVLAVLTPLWQAAPETASRIRGRIEAVLAAATAKGLRAGPNPAQWRNHLDRLLPKRRMLSRGHHAALAYREVPAFIRSLRSVEGVSALALEFLILTACRSGEALGARWPEVDLQTQLWTVPAERMKSGRAHRVPLSDRAVALLQEAAVLRLGRDDDFVFPGAKRRAGLSGMSLAMCLRRIRPGVTVHGFRSSFRDWAGEETAAAREVAEAALAHVVGDATERAYRRGDALDKRRALMAQWARFCEPPPSPEEAHQSDINAAPR